MSSPTMSLLDQRQPAEGDQQLTLDILDGREPQDAPGYGAQLVVPQLREHLLGHGNRSGGHAEFRQTESDEQRQQRRVRRHLAAQRYRNALTRGGASNHDDDPQYRRMERL